MTSDDNLFSRRLSDVRDLISDLEDFEEGLPNVFVRAQFSRLRRQTAPQYVWASHTGVSQTTIGNWERGYTSPERPYRRRLKKAVGAIKEGVVAHAFPVRAGTRLNVPATYQDLRHSILRAALTDFDFDTKRAQIVPIPFYGDIDSIAAEEIARDRKNLLESLAQQAEILTESLSTATNADAGKVIRYLENYKEESLKDEPNPRLLSRYGSIISRSANSDSIALGLNDIDSLALEGFEHDHIELMRLYFREALAKAQEVDAVEVRRVEQINDGTEFRVVADLLDRARDDSDAQIVAPAIPTLLRDIAAEIREADDQLLLSSEPSRHDVLKRRKSEAFKNGGIYVGRFVFFSALLSSMAYPAVAEIFASLGTIVGLTEVVVPGSVRAQYEILREKFPALPALPIVGKSDSDENDK